MIASFEEESQRYNDSIRSLVDMAEVRYFWIILLIIMIMNGLSYILYHD
jgi:hypothetical protein